MPLRRPSLAQRRAQVTSSRRVKSSQPIRALNDVPGFGSGLSGLLDQWRMIVRGCQSTFVKGRRGSRVDCYPCLVGPRVSTKRDEETRVRMGFGLWVI